VNNIKLAKILMVLLPIIILVLMIFLSLKAKKQAPVTKEEVSPPTPTPEAFTPSKWAGDEEVLKIESELLNLEELLKNVDLKESQLLPPVLDMEVKF